MYVHLVLEKKKKKIWALYLLCIVLHCVYVSLQEGLSLSLLFLFMVLEQTGEDLYQQQKKSKFRQKLRFWRNQSCIYQIPPL